MSTSVIWKMIGGPPFGNGSVPVTTVVSWYGLAAVPDPDSDWLTGVHGVSVSGNLPVVFVPPA